ncbi:MAG: AAA family ATPase [Patescibacteria group bacterium]|nr:AAA family ATPase [Patescibacteria group bacterium]
MNLVFIYGPPATGKLTVAKELAKLTGYKVFHNHLTVDLITSVLKFGEKNFFEISSRLRLEMIELAAKNNVNLIFTFCYVRDHDDKFVKDVIRKVKKYNGKICFAQLYSDKKELCKRVVGESRKYHGKIRTAKKLNSCLKEFNLFLPIPFVKNLNIDNTKISAKKVAKMIKEKYKL